MPICNRDGVDLYYEVHGSGPAILLTHGFSATSKMWASQIDALGQSHTLILWDMRGHGQSGSPDDQALYSEAHTTADMCALLDHLDIKQAIVGGLSLGGYMSLAFYADYPERVQSLLIIDTGPGFKRDTAREAWNQNALQTGRNIAENGAGALAQGSAERATSVHNSYAGLARAAQGMLTQRNSRVIESLPGIAVPAIVVVGANDAPFLAASDYMAAKIPGAVKVVVPDAGHAVNVDQPEAFNKVIGDFLNEKS